MSSTGSDFVTELCERCGQAPRYVTHVCPPPKWTVHNHEFPAATERRLEVERIRRLERVAEAARAFERFFQETKGSTPTVPQFEILDRLQWQLVDALAALDAA